MTAGHQTDFGQDEIGNGAGIVQIEDGNPHVRQRAVAGDRTNAWVSGRDQRVPGFGAMGLDLGMAVALETFDQDQIHRADLLEKVLQRGLIRIAIFVHQRPTVSRGQQHLGRTGQTVPMAVPARLVDIKRMMRVLERGDSESAPGNL